MGEVFPIRPKARVVKTPVEKLREFLARSCERDLAEEIGTILIRHPGLDAIMCDRVHKYGRHMNAMILTDPVEPNVSQNNRTAAVMGAMLEAALFGYRIGREERDDA